MSARSELGPLIAAALLIAAGCASPGPASSALSPSTQSAWPRDTPIAAPAPAKPLPPDDLASMQSPHRSAAGDRLMRQGNDASIAGATADAADAWTSAARAYSDAKRYSDQCDALVKLGGARQSLGGYCESIDALSSALSLARRLNDRPRQVEALCALAATYTLMHRYESAEAAVNEGLKLTNAAAGGRGGGAAACLFENLGLLDSAQARCGSAAAAFEQSAADYETFGDAIGATRAQTRAVVAHLRAGHVKEAIALNRKIGNATHLLPSSHDKANLLLRQGRAWQSAAGGAAGSKQEYLAEARAAYRAAAGVARLIGDQASLSFALGFQGELAEGDKDLVGALDLTRQALASADASGSGPATYRWQWQLGRIFRDQGNDASAISAYTSAIDTLDAIRSDVIRNYDEEFTGQSYHEMIASLYGELADLLRRQANATTDPAAVQRLLLQARNITEQQKIAESAEPSP